MTGHLEAKEGIPTNNYTIDTDMDSSSYGTNGVSTGREPLSLPNGEFIGRHALNEDPVCVVGMGT